jgi:hypothetical protein
MDSDILYNISLSGDEHFEPQKYIDYPTVKESTNSYNIEFPINKLLINRVEQIGIIQELVSKKKIKNSNNNIKDKTILNKKRKNQKKEGKRNKNTRKDNIRNKITKCFLKFLIIFINAIIQRLLIEEDNVQQYKLKAITYEENINIDNIKKLKEKTIKDIISMKKSGKYKDENKNENENTKICNIIVEKDKKIENILNQKYMEFFSVFCGTKKLIDLSKYGINIEIPLNSDMILYKDLIEKIKNKKNKNDLDQYLKKFDECINDYKEI